MNQAMLQESNVSVCLSSLKLQTGSLQEVLRVGKRPPQAFGQFPSPPHSPRILHPTFAITASASSASTGEDIPEGIFPNFLRAMPICPAELAGASTVGGWVLVEAVPQREAVSYVCGPTCSYCSYSFCGWWPGLAHHSEMMSREDTEPLGKTTWPTAGPWRPQVLTTQCMVLRTHVPSLPGVRNAEPQAPPRAHRIRSMNNPFVQVREAMPSVTCLKETSSGNGRMAFSREEARRGECPPPPIAQAF